MCPDRHRSPGRELSYIVLQGVQAAEAEHEAKIVGQWQPPATETKTHITQELTVSIGADLSLLNVGELQCFDC